MRKVCYITGTRADFGLMQESLLAINEHPELSLGVIVTGMHLLTAYGETWQHIEKSGLTILEKVPVELSGGSGAEMAISLGEQVIGFTQALEREKPDLVLLLGDRGEMLAGAVAALHLNIPLVHIHGGELSGTVDESVRHAISKLSHYHFTSTEASRERLIRMGEHEGNVFVTGAPGLDEISQARLKVRDTLFTEYGLDPALPMSLVLFHSVVQQAADAELQAKIVLDAVNQNAAQALVIMPNADAGGASIAAMIDRYDAAKRMVKTIHVPRGDFLSFLKEAEMLIGNSSSGIIEAASLGTPVVNIGDRQRCRERNPNVIDVPVDACQITAAIQQARASGPYTGCNVYGDGETADRITRLLVSLPLHSKVLEKVNAY